MKNLILLSLLLILFYSKESFSQNIWEPTSGPNGEDIEDVLITSDHTLVISEYDSGIFFSNDKGDTWQKISKGLPQENSYAESIAAGTNGIVYAVINSELYKLNGNADEWVKLKFLVTTGTFMISNDLGNLYFINRETPAIVCSYDQGETFQNIITFQQFNKINLTALMGDGNNFISVTENGIYNLYRINDDGSGLIKIMDSTSSVFHLFWHPAGYLFVNTNNSELIRMDRNGKNRIINDTFDLIVNKFAIKQNGDIMAFTEDHDFISTDFGLNWYIISSRLYAKINSESKIFYNENDFYSYSFDEFCFNGSFQKTANDGISWTLVNNSSSSTRVYDIFIDRSERIFTKACNFGKYTYSLDKGKLWNELILPEPEFGNSFSTDLVSTATGDLFVRLDGGKIYKSNIFGSNWSELVLPQTTYIVGLTGDHNNIIYAFGNPFSWTSKDGGQNWNKIGTPNLTFNPNRIYFHPDGTLFVVHHDMLHRIIPEVAISNDNGLHWTTLKLNFFQIHSFAISKKGVIYFSGFSNPSNPDSLFVSYDKLQTLTVIKPGGYLRALITDDDETLYAALGSETERSVDEGKTWKPFNTGIPTDRFATCIAIDKNQQLYLGFDDDVVYKTTNSITETIDTKEKKSNTKIQVHPNPTDDKFIVAINADIKFPLAYQLYDTYGLRFLYGEIKSEKSVINIQSIPDGIYLLKFGDPRLPVQKIIVNH